MIEKWQERIEARWRFFLLSAVGLLVLFTFLQRYPMDDAFISFRYADHLAKGLGLVWNPGQRIEGFSNFLWTILLAFGIRLGVAPESFSLFLASIAYCASLALTYLIGLRVIRTRWSSLLLVVAVAFTRSFYGLATSGLETPLQIALTLGLVYLALRMVGREWNWKEGLVVSCFALLAVLNRLDALLPIGVIGYFILAGKSKRSARNLAAFPSLFLILLAIFLVWKAGYFGDVVPNSFHAKVRGGGRIAYGLLYLHLFAACLFLYPTLLIASSGLVKAWRNRLDLRLISAVVVSWLGYIVWVGGDFMEFRFLTPILPLLFLLIIEGARQLSIPILKQAVPAMLLVGVLHSNFGMEWLLFGEGIESISRIKSHLYQLDHWEMIGKRLGTLFGGSDVSIAVGAAGAMPYYSCLRTIDVMGLNDRQIPRTGVSFSRVAGHRVIATLDYLTKQKVNLIIEPSNFILDRKGFNEWSRSTSWRRDIYWYYIDPDRPVDGKRCSEATLVALPMEEDFVLVAWYLTPNPTIDRMIADNGWKTFRLRRDYG